MFVIGRICLIFYYGIVLNCAEYCGHLLIDTKSHHVYIIWYLCVCILQLHSRRHNHNLMMKQFIYGPCHRCFLIFTQERLESFYVSQADLYDSYRHRMLHGRFPMIKAMPAPEGGVWVDMGGGTGSNLEYYGSNLNNWGKVRKFMTCYYSYWF